MNLQKKYKEQLLSIIHKHLPGCKVYLFGSRATGTQRPGSDIDLALDTGKPIPFNTILSMQIDIEETTIPMKVDLIDIQKAPEELKQEILSKGILWTP